MNISFSFIIPVYNVENYLDECVKSVLSQTYKNFEIILVDDGSTDRSGKICDLWKSKDSRIFVIHQENQGLSEARNRGLSLAHNQYIIFLDSDDKWQNEECLNIIKNRLEITNPEVLILNFNKLYSNRIEKNYFQCEDMPISYVGESNKYIMDNNLWSACAWNKVIKNTIKNIQFIANITSEDVDWCFRLFINTKHFDYINLPVIFYRQRATSITGTSSVKKTECLYNNILVCEKILNTTSNLTQEEIAYLKKYISYQYAIFIFSLSGFRLNRNIPIYESAKQKWYWLSYSDSIKTKLIYHSVKNIGFDKTLWLLELYRKIYINRNKRN